MRDGEAISRFWRAGLDQLDRVCGWVFEQDLPAEEEFLAPLPAADRARLEEMLRTPLAP